MKVYQRLAQAFKAEGTKATFGMMGDGNMYWIYELDRMGVKIHEVRHEGAGLGMADGYPGSPGIGAVTAAQMLNRYGPIEDFPPEALGERRDLALLFKDLATLRTHAPLFRDVDELEWRGPTGAFAPWAERVEAPRLLERSRKAERASKPK